MPNRTLTAEQRQAISTRDVSIALSAGAGCGKTFVLVERFLSHLDRQNADDGREATRLGQLIAITFTDAAAREMRERIRSRCYERLDLAASRAQQQHWLRLLREIDGARVGTIHAFCASLLRAHAAEAGVDPTFRVLDQGGADVLRTDVIDDVLRERLASLDEQTLDLAATFGLARLKQQIAVLLGERHRPEFDAWLAKGPEDIVESWRAWYATNALPAALDEIQAAAPVAELIQLLSDVRPTSDMFVEARQRLLQLLPRLLARQATAAELDAICDFARMRSRAGPYICTAREWGDKAMYERYSNGCKTLRESIEQHAPATWDEAAARATAALGAALLQLSAAVAAVYSERKTALGVLDFDDLLVKAYALTTAPQNAALRERLADDLRLLLVDEFQDTDALQADLVKALCGTGMDAGRLFFVGDYKQSIYRFRGAAPHVFRNLQQDIAARGRLPLNRNFRSQPAVLDFVNALCCQALSRADQAYEPLRADRPQVTTTPCVEFLWTITPDKYSRAQGAMEEARRAEARALARRLRALVDAAGDEQPIVDRRTGAPRAAQPGDIAILFRALSDVQLYEAALREYELPYYLVGGHAFYAQQEVYDVLNLLRSVASSADEVSLAGVLRSPFFALADETLFWLKETAGSLNAGLLLEALPAELSDDERSKVAAAAETIRLLRQMKDRVPIASLLAAALDRTGYDAVLLGEFLGERKLANLHKLLEQARAADRGITDLSGFITQLGQFIAQEPKEALAATQPEHADVIRLMTIHHAKGLEFPFVVLPDLDRPPRSTTPCAALDHDLGPLVPWPGDERRKPTTGMKLFMAKERGEELAERNRLLYVAATRAADYLILSSSLQSFDETRSDWMKLLAERFELASGNLRASLPADFAPPSVRVVVDPEETRKPVGMRRGPDLAAVLDEAQRLAASQEGFVPAGIAEILPDPAARRQFSVSQWTGRLLPDEALDDSPAEPQAPSHTASPRENRDTALELGTFVHAVLAHMDWKNGAAVGAWCERLATERVTFLDDRVVAEAQELVERFGASPRARQLAQAAKVYAELEFLLAWPLAATGSDARFIRGFIDCLYQTADGGWHLIDYKTNHVTAEEVAREAAGYELQLGVYALAAEQALGQPLQEVVLHFLRPGIEPPFCWNEATRRRTIECVDQAIARMTIR